jgi:hypothetical protein
MSTDLPAWDQMTDPDKHEALWHVWKREKDGREYAIEHYPTRYTGLGLTGLDSAQACAHAKQVVVSINSAYRRLGDDEYWRLMNLNPKRVTDVH